MSLEKTFLSKFQGELDIAQRTGFMSAAGAGAGTGITAALPYFVQGELISVLGAWEYSPTSSTCSSYDLCQFNLYDKEPLQLRHYDASIYVGLIQCHVRLSISGLQYVALCKTLTFFADMIRCLLSVPSVAKSRMAAASFSRLWDMDVESDELKGDLRLPINGRIKFDKVAFNYPTRPDAHILQDISFELRKGDCVCLVGPSGSGKSTISALLQRLYEPLRGTIQIDNLNLNQIDVKWLRHHVAVVSQQPNLFDASVAENIAYGSEAVSIDAIHHAAKTAAVHDFIMSLPQGYDTNLGENASLISGGQAQRLQIARALLKRSSILILDECTSALDPENQQLILDTVMRIKGDRTTIFISHKADVMKRCDRVLCMSEGRIAEDGSYTQLMTRRGVFSRLMQAAEFE